MIRVLIIEDEAPAYRRLSQLLESHHLQFEVIEVLDSISEALKWFRNHNTPDLIFSDIHLSDGLSFEIYESFQPQCPIIFTTAYDEYALEAFKTFGIDYLLKPIQIVDLERAIQKFELIKGNKATNNFGIEMEKLLQKFNTKQIEYKERFLIKTGSKWQPIFVDEIAFFCYREGFSELFTNQGKHFLCDESLDVLEAQLNPNQFFRANRQLLVHINSIKQVQQHLKGRLCLELSPKCPVESLISRDRARALKDWLSGTTA